MIWHPSNALIETSGNNLSYVIPYYANYNILSVYYRGKEA